MDVAVALCSKDAALGQQSVLLLLRCQK